MLQSWMAPARGGGGGGARAGIRKPISVARRVMESTPHVMLAGVNARRFALQEGFPSAELLSPDALSRSRQWKQERTMPGLAHFGDLGPRQKAGSEAGGNLEQNSHDTV